MDPQDYKIQPSVVESQEMKQLKVDLKLAQVQIATLEGKCKELMLENMELRDENAKLNDMAGQAFL